MESRESRYGGASRQLPFASQAKAKAEVKKKVKEEVGGGGGGGGGWRRRERREGGR